MTTSIKILISIIFFHQLCFFQNIFSQEYIWKNIPVPEGINSPDDDFNPVILDKQFMFSRLVKGLPRQYVIYNNTITPHIWQQSGLKGFHHIVYPMKYESTLFFSSTYTTLKRSFLGIFELRDDKILNPLGQTDPGYFASHPCMTSDGQTLFFASDKEGSIGGTDLWYYSKNTKGDWIGPYPMGDYINSPGNEINPFSPHPDTLYYSTDGHGGKGGFDILMSVREKGMWLEPVPLDEVNSRWNDMEFAILNDTLAAFTSDKPGGMGKLDIYMVKKSFQPNVITSYLSLTSNTKLIEQEVEKTENALAFRSFIFFRNNKLTIDDESMLKTLSQQLKESPDAKVFLTLHPMTENVIRILRSYSIPSSQIVIDSTVLESMILISADKSEVYGTHPSIESVNTPQNFDVFISSVPTNNMFEWEISLKDSILKKGNILPDSIQYNTNFSIDPYQDSIVFHARASNMMGMEIRDSIIIPIQRQVIDLSEKIDNQDIPVMWHMKEFKAALPHFLRFAQCMTKKHAESQEFKDGKKHVIQLFVSEYNAATVENLMKILQNEPELRDFEIAKTDMTQDHPQTRMLRFSITRVPHYEYAHIIPILIH